VHVSYAERLANSVQETWGVHDRRKDVEKLDRRVVCGLCSVIELPIACVVGDDRWITWTG
jgi:hypothetical protein